MNYSANKQSNATGKFNLADIPSSSSSYKYLKLTKSKLVKQGPGASLNKKFSPSLLKVLDFKLGSELDNTQTVSLVNIYQFSFRWVNPNAVQENGAAVAGLLLLGPLAPLVTAAAASSKGRHDELVCYFMGEYKGKPIEVNKSESCPQGSPYCFGSSPIKPLDEAWPATKAAAEKLGADCIAEITENIKSINASTAQSAAL